MTDQYFSSSHQDSGNNLRSNGMGTKLPDFSQDLGVGFPQPIYHPERSAEERWSLYLRWVQLLEGSNMMPCGWGATLGEAYEHYVGLIKNRHCIVLGEMKILVPSNLTP